MRGRANLAARPAPTRQERRRLSHVDRLGRPRMVDVSDKPVTARRAVAEATVKMDQETLTLIIDGSGPKGDVLSVAELAGIMAAKRTAELIPLCHPLALSDVTVEITPDRKAGVLAHQRQRRDDRPDRGGDGGHDGGVGRCPDRLRHGQERRQVRHHHEHPAHGEERRLQRPVAPARSQGGRATPEPAPAPTAGVRARGPAGASQ